MIDRGFPRSRLKGSWAGATGHPQFLPSVYLRLGVDGDGDGRADIWRSEPDALASIANYLSNAGWRPGVPWGVAVRVPAGFDRAGCRNRLARAALPAGLRAPQPLADDRRMAPPRHRRRRAESGRATPRWPR